MYSIDRYTEYASLNPYLAPPVYIHCTFWLLRPFYILKSSVCIAIKMVLLQKSEAPSSMSWHGTLLTYYN